MQIIKTREELEKVLCEIRAKDAKAKEEQDNINGHFYLSADLIALLPKSGQSPHYRSEPTGKACYGGNYTELFVRVDWYARHSRWSCGAARLSFYVNYDAYRCIKTEEMYLYYDIYSEERARELTWLDAPDVVRKWQDSATVKMMKKPNKIGTLSPSKLKAWTDYYKTLRAKCEELENAAQSRIAAFRSKLRTICPEKADCDAGHIEVGDLTFSWDIQKDGYVDAVTRVTPGIDTFMHLIGK